MIKEGISRFGRVLADTAMTLQGGWSPCSRAGKPERWSSSPIPGQPEQNSCDLFAERCKLQELLMF